MPLSPGSRLGLSVSRLSVRAQLGLLIVAILVPVFSALALYVIRERQQALDAARQEVQRDAQWVAKNLERFFGDHQVLLSRLAERPQVRALDPAQCDPFLIEYASLHPEFNNVVVRDLAGERVCSVRAAVASATELKAYPWFERTLQSDRFMVGDIFIGPIAKRWVTMLSHPVRNTSGKVSGFVMVPADLLQISQAVLSGTPGDVLAVVNDPSPRIALRSHEPEAFIGKATPARVASVTKDQASGYAKLADVNGVQRLWAFTEVPGTGWRAAAGMREDQAFAAADASLRKSVLAGLILLLASLLMAWRISRLIVRPIDALAAVSSRVAAGDVDARMPVGGGPQEIETVAREFNRMLDVRGLVEAALKEREQRLSFLLSRTSAAIFTSKASGDFAFTFVSDSVYNLLGYTAQEFLSTPNFWTSHMHPDDVERFSALKPSLFVEETLVFEYRLLHKDGQYRWLRDEIRLFRDVQGEPQEIIGFLVDITDSRSVQDELRANEARFRTLTQLGSDWYWEQDEQFRFVQIDGKLPVVEGMSANAYVGRTRWETSHSGVSEAQWVEHRAILEAHETFHGFEMQRPGPEGSTIWVSLSGTPIVDELGVFRGYRGIGRDITAQKQAAEQIHALAFYDALTGLPNRRLLTEQLKKSLTAHIRNDRQGALLFIDLDNFKTLNDTLGHDMGDLLLQQVAQRLTACVREADTVARLGGDEFVVILEELGEDPASAASRAEAVGRKIIAALSEPYELAGRMQRSTPSIGITLFGRYGYALDDLLKQADLAMYQAKAEGRNTLRFFDAQMQATVSSRVSMETDLRDGLKREEFCLHYQPVVRSSGQVMGAEALVRWQRPGKGLVPPGEFIPLAEATGLIVPLGRWVLRTACEQLVTWGSRPEMAHLTLAVNVSTPQFREPNFVALVLDILADSGANPRRLRLELTESLLADDVEDIITKMLALKDYGVSFSLDDFGTGYSSLSYLKRLPLDQIKIDQTFVRDVLVDPNDASIARTIVALGDSLGLGVVAEGVETEGQRQFLECSGCYAFQGYLFSRPLPIADFDAIVAG
ncbi:MAG TPA: EAL domain-containing protein [Burkholderiaceae bacterium]|nr:EAL domain-containing protein [Burkholderiaceae bacterium]HPW09064.1 EAL domain-containing protein [Burkholderiaceae bacterium]